MNFKDARKGKPWISDDSGNRNRQLWIQMRWGFGGGLVLALILMAMEKGWF